MNKQFAVKFVYYWNIDGEKEIKKITVLDNIFATLL